MVQNALLFGLYVSADLIVLIMLLQDRNVISICQATLGES